MFAEFDKEGSGSASPAEVLSGLKTSAGLEITPRLQAMVGDMTHRDGRVYYLDFLTEQLKHHP